MYISSNILLIVLIIWLTNMPFAYKLCYNNMSLNPIRDIIYLIIYIKGEREIDLYDTFLVCCYLHSYALFMVIDTERMA